MTSTWSCLRHFAVISTHYFQVTFSFALSFFKAEFLSFNISFGPIKVLSFIPLCLEDCKNSRSLPACAKKKKISQSYEFLHISQSAHNNVMGICKWILKWQTKETKKIEISCTMKHVKSLLGNLFLLKKKHLLLPCCTFFLKIFIRIWTRNFNNFLI